MSVCDDEDSGISPQKYAAIAKWRDVFKRAGFHDYMIDFSACSPEMIACLGEAIEQFERREHAQSEPKAEDKP